MRQIPLLFSPAMIEALLAGRKTETRRELNPQPLGGFEFDCFYATPNGKIHQKFRNGKKIRSSRHKGCIPGDLIWVKEAHYAYGYWRTIPGVFTKKTGKPKREFVRDAGHCVTKGELASKKAIKVRPNNLDVLPGNLNMRPGWYARPSMFMFKADSRLTLRVTGFNIERLSDITEAAAIAEGIEQLKSGRGYYDPTQSKGMVHLGDYFKDAKSAYACLWDDINGPGAWDRDPWVECTKFEVIKRNVGLV